MKCFVGIDLGSTTTKAIILDEQSRIIGRGITNSRSNYDVACKVAKTEAYINARFGLLERNSGADKALLGRLENSFRLEQYLEQSAMFLNEMRQLAGQARYAEVYDLIHAFLEQFEKANRHYGTSLFLGQDKPKSDFFRDLVGSCFNQQASDFSGKHPLSFDTLLGLFDKCIIRVENQELELGFEGKIRPAFERITSREEHPGLFAAIAAAIGEPLEETRVVGTGYGRQRLPFPKEQIRSEILCHGLGAHFMFPGTRTVLDIGGQDTKAIQVDGAGIVTSFQMNDRCAAGCGRYLGYIAEEMNLALQELGPLANSAEKAVKINSTCTVFAGAELRDRLSDGQRREEILLGLHRAIIYRALSLLARSGGIENEFTFTGGVAKNEAALAALKELIVENYGQDIVINVAPDSIFTGAIGAALFALREQPAAVVEDLEGVA